MIDALRQMVGMDARSYILRVPRQEEIEGMRKFVKRIAEQIKDDQYRDEEEYQDFINKNRMWIQAV